MVGKLAVLMDSSMVAKKAVSRVDERVGKKVSCLAEQTVGKMDMMMAVMTAQLRVWSLYTSAAAADIKSFYGGCVRR